MSPVLLFCILVAYFSLLLGVAWATSRNATNDSFFIGNIGNKSSNWMLVAFGILTKRALADRLVLLVTIGAPLICALLEVYQEQLLGSYRLGLELLMINGILVFAGLWAISRPARLDVLAAAT